MWGNTSSHYIEVSGNMGILCMIFSMLWRLHKADLSIKVYSVSGDERGDCFTWFVKHWNHHVSKLKKLCFEELDNAVSSLLLDREMGNNFRMIFY